MKKHFIICIILTLVSVLWSIEANAQSTAADNQYTSSKFLGWDNTSGDLPFKTNNTTRMTLQNTTGYFGIGTSFSPSYKLDVDNGDINLNTSSKGYRIAGNIVLRTGGNNNDILVGYNAGNGAMTGTYNICVGKGAGNSLTTSQQNTFIGYQAGNSATTYGVSGGPGNVAVGYQAMFNNTNLSKNTAIGHQALFSSNSCTGCYENGSLNTAVGFQALYTSQAYGGTALGFQAAYLNNLGCGTLAIGEEAMHDNANGNYNVAVGNAALHENTDLGFNVALGHWALFAQNYDPGSPANSNNVAVGIYALTNNNPTSSSNGIENTSVGNYSLYANTNGHSNTAIGYNAGASCLTGDSNVFVGYGADMSAAGFGNYNNCASFGYGAIASASDKFYFGNAKVIECRALLWTSTSDGRFKINVQENVSGLDFINRLRPVTYNMDAQALDAFINPNVPQTGDFTDATNRVHSGFIAQEVEQAALASGFTSSIVSLPGGTNDPYGLNYPEFVVPLVKAIQELDSINQSLQDQIDALQSGNRIIPDAQGQGINQSGEQRNTGSIELQNLQTLQLLNADPNPFKENTIIRWNIPDQFNDAVIYFYDNTGTKINSYQIEQQGSGELQIFGSKLSSGVYTYSLVVDSKLIDSKKLVKAK